MEFSIKAFLQKVDSSVEVRRISVLMQGEGNSGIFKLIVSKVASAFPDLHDKSFTLMWKDADGDLILMSSDEEVLEALAQKQETALKIYLTIDREMESNASSGEVNEPQASSGEGSNHQKEDPCAANWSFMGPLGMPIPPPPPPPPPPGFQGHPHPFGDPMGFHGPMRKWGFQGPFGRHGPFGGCPMFGGPGAWGPHGAFHGHHPPPPPPPPFGHAMFGPHHHHHGGPMGKGHHGGKGWKANLRDSVPVTHRRWAKFYIRNWRVQNLKNATSTSSDSEQGQIMIDAASVPEAYARWLDIVLPKWHRKLGHDDQQKGKDDKDKERKEEKKQMKASTPIEFRKWAKWYFARHYGPREAPRFKQGAPPQQAENAEAAGKGGKKAWKKACKMQTLNASVPLKHRVWARAFIRQWRLENNIVDPGVTSSESEDTDKEIVYDENAVPADYARWLHKFLPRWHMWRGQIDAQKVTCEKGGMGEFKDTVPMDFRTWVKCFMCRRYNKVTKKNEADPSSQYQKWLLAFQQKWLEDQENGKDSDGIGFTTSDDDDTDFGQDVETSFKRLRLMEDAQAKSQKNVRFDASVAMESDDGHSREPFQKKLNPGFRQWAKEALSQWDGTTSPFGGQPRAVHADSRSSQDKREGQGTSQAAGEEIPPHVYNWMAKMMMKMQMKKMKREMKEAKRELKAAKKAQKFKYYQAE